MALGGLVGDAGVHFDFIAAPYAAAALEEKGSFITNETIDARCSADVLLRI